MMEPDGLFGALLNAWYQHTAFEIALAMLIVFVATSVQVGVGIAFGLIAAPLLALIDIAFVPAPVLFLTLFTAVTASWRERGGIRWDQLRYSVSGRLIGSISGAMVLTLIPGDKTFMLIFGLIIALAVIISFSGIRIPFTLASIGVAGFASGFSAAITSVGGPPMAVVYQRQRSQEARPTLQMFFALGAFLTLLVLFIGGHLTSRDLALAILLVPALVMGFWAGPKLRPVFDRGFRPFLLGSAAIAAAVLIIKGLS